MNEGWHIYLKRAHMFSSEGSLLWFFSQMHSKTSEQSPKRVCQSTYGL